MNQPTHDLQLTYSENILLELALEILKRKELKAHNRSSDARIEDTKLLQAKLQAARVSTQ